jgi:hypothetical protein
MISSPMVFHQILLLAFLFPKSSSSLPHSCSSHLLLHNCCFRLCSFMPFLHSGPLQTLILDVYPFSVSRPALSWSYTYIL